MNETTARKLDDGRFEITHKDVIILSKEAVRARKKELVAALDQATASYNAQVKAANVSLEKLRSHIRVYNGLLGLDSEHGIKGMK